MIKTDLLKKRLKNRNINGTSSKLNPEFLIMTVSILSRIQGYSWEINSRGDALLFFRLGMYF